MRLLRRHLFDRIGRRGTVLLYLALLDFIYGFSLLAPDAQSITSPAYAFLRLVRPLSWWAVLWITVGAVCLVFAFRRRDGLGFAAAVFLKAVWGSLFLLGWIFADVARGWLAATVWLAFGALIWVISGWPDEYKDGHR